MMADGPAEVGVAPPTDPTVDTICALVFGGKGGGGGRCGRNGWLFCVGYVWAFFLSSREQACRQTRHGMRALGGLAMTDRGSLGSLLSRRRVALRVAHSYCSCGGGLGSPSLLHSDVSSLSSSDGSPFCGYFVRTGMGSPRHPVTLIGWLLWGCLRVVCWTEPVSKPTVALPAL